MLLRLLEPLAVTKAIPRMIVLMTVVLPAIAQFAEEAHPRPVRWEHCCEGGYSRSKALDRAMATLGGHLKTGQ